MDGHPSHVLSDGMLLLLSGSVLQCEGQPSKTKNY